MPCYCDWGTRTQRHLQSSWFIQWRHFMSDVRKVTKGCQGHLAISRFENFCISAKFSKNALVRGHVHAVSPRCMLMSMLHFHAVCPCCMPMPMLHVMSHPICPVNASSLPPVLFCLSFLPVLFCLSFLPVLFCLSWSAFPVLPFMFCLSCSAVSYVYLYVYIHKYTYTYTY